MRFTSGASWAHSGAPGRLLLPLNVWEGAEEDANPVRSEDGMLLLNEDDNLDEEAESLAITGPPSGCTPVLIRLMESLPEKLPLDEDDTLLVA
jgi:hypothetical protein